MGGQATDQWEPGRPPIALWLKEEKGTNFSLSFMPTSADFIKAVKL
jgi:hypothetical protein